MRRGGSIGKVALILPTGVIVVMGNGNLNLASHQLKHRDSNTTSTSVNIKD